MANWRNFTDGIKNWWQAKTGQALSNADVQANEFNAAEAQKARDFEVQMYEKYNSPRAMMSQYTDAGLNPALMYEGYSPSAPSSNAVADSVNPSAGDASMTDAIQSILGIISAKQQIDLNRAQIDSIKADTEGKNIDNANKQEMYDWQFDTSEANIKKIQSDIAKNSAEVDKIAQDIKESASRIDVNNKQIEIGDKKIELMGSEQELNETKAALNKLDAQKMEILMPYVAQVQEAQLKLTEAQTEQAKANAENQLAQAYNTFLKSMVEERLLNNGYYETLMLNQKREGAVMVGNAIVDNTMKVVGTVANIFTGGLFK